ncbi:hypothetical protein N9X67_04850 [Amylibacter sp.]|nr:hypothetical protein [Amylibacter sp.]
MAISKIGSKALVDCSVAAVDIEDGSITSAKLAGSIANAKLANSNVTVNGTSINLGDSGSIPAVSWQSVVVSDGSTVTTMVAGNGYFVNNTSAAGLVKLPISASAGDTVAIKDYAGNFGTNNLTIQRNGHNIQGVANDSLISTDRASLTLVYVDATKGWLYAVESNVADLEKALFITATGGTVTESGDFKIHSFTGDGCFVVSSAGNPIGSTSVDYLVVAGGGAAGACTSAGGGAGGYRESHSTPVSGCYSASPLATPTGITVTATTYPVTVGAGGAGTSNPASPAATQNGSNSVFSTITSAGGGGSKNADNAVGGSGGSGGGGGFVFPGSLVQSPDDFKGAGNTPPVSPPQGNPGGKGYNAYAPFSPASLMTGGGGGAGAAGQNGGPTGAGGIISGGGGNGVSSSITGSSVARAGGGAGGVKGGGSVSPGGTGGGGGTSPVQNVGCAGAVNTGGGAGGTSDSLSTSAAGGSGIVIIRYKFQ